MQQIISRPVAEMLDELPFSAFQLFIVLLISAAMILDGMDNQMLGLAAPSLLKAWGLHRSALESVFLLGFAGMVVGTLVSGWIGDRYGRRPALLFCITIFGAATIASGFSQNLAEIACCKALAGLGLGGMACSGSPAIAEITPRRWRSLAITFANVCVSVGGIIGGLAASAILPASGWRALFFIAGGFTLCLLAITAAFLPESPRFLARRPARKAELAALLRRIGAPLPETATADELAVEPQSVPFKTLFTARFRRDVIALSFAMFSGLFMIYLMFNWSPTLLSSLQFNVRISSLGLTAFNLGGTVGALAAATLIARTGSRIPLVAMAAAGTAICAALGWLHFSGGVHAGRLLVLLCGLGLFASAAQSAIYAVGAHVFPTEARARGISVMSAAGRLGAIFSALLGNALIGAGNAGFFGALALLMFVNACGFAFIRNHVPPLAKAAP